MSALDRSQALNALNLKPALPAVAAAPARSQDKGPEGQDETSKARFSRLLAHSRAEASQKPVDTPDRAAKTPASPTRSSRADARKNDDPADKADDEVEARPSSAPSRSGVAARSATARDTQDPASSDDKATDAESTANAAAPEAAPQSAIGNPSDLAAWLASLPPAPTAPNSALPTAGDVSAAPGDATDGTDPPTNLLATLGQAGPDTPGLETALAAAAGSKASDAGAAHGLASTTERWLGQTPPTPALVDSKALPDASAGAAALPPALLANLAAGTLGVGKSEDAPKTSAALDVLPLASSAAIAGHGVASLARSVDTAASASATVPTPVGDPGFHEALAAQVSVFARAGLSKAELHMNPAELGPVSVHIMMNGDQARVDFGADRAQTRQAIEAGWAELAASLQDAGFTLSGGGVSEQAQRQAAERQATSQGTRTGRAVAVDDVPAASIVAARPRAGSALDLYA
ncbi:MAG: hypothetical protein CFE40_00245 [Burkholderiales bacterium PBB1]|nr:MAG: hypothetical protein CFE40_00245 [Burkholderiales bacterium PBB1]